MITFEDLMGVHAGMAVKHVGNNFEQWCAANGIDVEDVERFLMERGESFAQISKITNTELPDHTYTVMSIAFVWGWEACKREMSGMKDVEWMKEVTDETDA